MNCYKYFRNFVNSNCFFMKIGVIVAMGKELELFLPILNNRTEKKIDHLTFYSGIVGPHELVVMQCGIGKVNASIGTLTMIKNYAPELIINSGVAGGGDASIHVMDVVVGQRVAYHDVWCGPESELGAVQGLPLYYEAPSDVLALIPERNDVKLGLICSGDQFIDNIDSINRIKQNFPETLAVDMESGSIAQTCYIYHVPFLSIRVISDSPCANDDNTSQYQDFWLEAPEHTFSLVHDLIMQI